MAMAVVMTRASTRGRVGIRWDVAATTTFDLGVGPKTLRWIVASTRWGSTATRHVTVTLLTGSPESTDIDGFVVLRAAGG